MLRDRAGQVERDGRSPRSDRQAHRDRLFPSAPPHAFGGFEADPRDYYAAGAISRRRVRIDGVGGVVVGVHPWQLALFDVRAQRDVWGANPTH